MADEQPVLVFGDDGSPSSDTAWLWVNNHHWTGWRLERLTASTVTVKSVGPLREVHEVEREVFDDAGFDASTSSYVDGDPRLVLGAATHASLMVVGNQGRSAWRDAWVGSTTSWLMQDPPAPLVVVRHGRRTERALVAVDGSPHADAAVDALLALPWIGGLEVIVVAVDDGRTDAASSVEAAARRLDGAAASVTSRVLEGHVTDALVDAATAGRCDLVAMGTRGLTGWSRLRVGSTSAAVVHHAGCTTLLASAD